MPALAATALVASLLTLPVASATALDDRDLTRLTVTQAAPPPPPSPSSAKLLFSSGFEGSVFLSAPNDCWGTGCWQNIGGTDGITGFWPPRIWGGGTARFQLIVDGRATAATIGNYFNNEIQTVTGHDGNATRALYTEIKRKISGGVTQNVFVIMPPSEQGDLYMRYWIKPQPDLVQKMTPQNWRSFFEWKTNGDYRVTVNVNSWEDGCGGVKPNGPLYWQVQGDNEANGGLPYQQFWRVDNCSLAVPVGEWFKFEVFWHRSSGNNGRVWVAVNGRVIADRYGSNMGVNNARINRIFIPTYTGAPAPIYQWIDDLEIWDGFPPDAAPH